ncbi:MAG: LON peptidase substrate-binding domain-containing protein, partial [Candidatus Rokuibacteriota bacterium]
MTDARAEPGPPGADELKIPDALPVLPLRGTVIFPLAVVPLAVGQPRSVRLVDDVLRRDRLLALVAQRDPEVEQAGPDDLYRVGTAGMIHQLSRLPDGSLRVIVQGLERVRLTDFVGTDPYLVARVAPAPDGTAGGTPTPEGAGLRRAAVDLFKQLVELVGELPDELAAAAESLPEPRQVAYLIATAMPLDTAVRQEILELDPVDAKLRRLVDLLQRERAVREIGRKITSDTQERLSKTQRDFFLREQLRSIQKELGEDGADGETAELRRRIAEAGLGEEARREADRELARLTSIPAASPEHALVRTYLEWLADLPWSRLTGGTIDVRRTREVLDEDHYDLEKIKDRIVEYLAVKKLRADPARAAVPP